MKCWTCRATSFTSTFDKLHCFDSTASLRFAKKLRFSDFESQNFLCQNHTENIWKPLRKPCMWYIKKVINYQYILGEWFLMSAIHEGATSCWASEGGWVGSTFLNHCFPSGKWCYNTPLTTSRWHDCNYCNSFIDSVGICHFKGKWQRMNLIRLLNALPFIWT